MLAVALILTLSINKDLTGLGVGTVICTVINAPIITLWGRLFDKFIDFGCVFPKLKKLLSSGKGEEVTED